MTKYKYNKRDLFIQKENYMFSNYEGPDFIRLYLNNRKKLKNDIIVKFTDKTFLEFYFTTILNILVKNKIINQKQLSEIYYLLPEIKKNGKNKIIKNNIQIKNEKKIKTEDLILELLNNFQLKKNKKIFEILIKKFEVSKKLAIYYDQNFKKISNFSKNKNLYILFTFLVAIYYKKSSDIRYLNTMLKLNDLNTSVFTNQTSKNVAKIFLLIELELCFVSQILQKNEK